MVWPANDNLRPAARWRAQQARHRDNPWMWFNRTDGVLDFPPCDVPWIGFIDPPSPWDPEEEIRAFVHDMRSGPRAANPSIRRLAAEVEGYLREPFRHGWRGLGG